MALRNPACVEARRQRSGYVQQIPVRALGKERRERRRETDLKGKCKQKADGYFELIRSETEIEEIPSRG